jgi:hypothetical protein
LDVIAFLHDMLRSVTLSSEKSHEKMNSLSKYKKNISSIPITKISPNRRLCYANEAILTLCHAIRLQGQRDPITVFFDGESFKIIDGEKRWRACKKLGVTRLNVVITETYYTF